MVAVQANMRKTGIYFKACRVLGLICLFLPQRTGAAENMALPAQIQPGWTSTASMSATRYLHAATLLRNGKVLIAGGRAGAEALSAAELYDPATGTFSATGSLTAGRYFHTATLLPSGKVLVVGGTRGTKLTFS